MRRLDEICNLINGQLIGGGDLLISGAASIKCASEGDITFVSDQKYVEGFLASKASAAIVATGIQLTGKPTIVCSEPEKMFAQVVADFRPPVQRTRIGISPAAHVSPSAQIGENVDIYPGAFVGDHVTIGDNTVIHPNVTIMERCSIAEDVVIFPSVVLYEDTKVGRRVILHSGVVLGAYGFGYKTSEGQHHLSAQLGNVVIEDDVEIGANSTIDRGTYDSTVIGMGTKIDNLVMIAHNCQIGQHNILCSQVGIAGSSSTENHVVMAGQVGIGDHLNIGSEVLIHAKSGVMSDVEPKQALFGIPAMPIREKMRLIAVQAKLPDMRRQLKSVEKQIKSLKQLAESGVERCEADLSIAETEAA